MEAIVTLDPCPGQDVASLVPTGMRRRVPTDQSIDVACICNGKKIGCTLGTPCGSCSPQLDRGHLHSPCIVRQRERTLRRKPIRHTAQLVNPRRLSSFVPIPNPLPTPPSPVPAVCAAYDLAIRCRPYMVVVLRFRSTLAIRLRPGRRRLRYRNLSLFPRHPLAQIRRCRRHRRFQRSRRLQG
ncbi:hypothetical protein SORBI_3002G178601 [Sorghum bicolor]|uniref:Uncharacterized protein n=1 Tax=Sorghum bicolor TaxID=4558 RepID=A0A1W0W4V1_SORBI|nr:hypothetical protein SORBI_3002G178601 [Sorghum bicolor]